MSITTTASILTLGFSCVIGFAIIQAVIWCLEVLFATAKYIICYLINRPSNWKDNYLEIRIIFTWVLNWLSFGELNAETIYKHRKDIDSYVNDLTHRRDTHSLISKWNEKRDKHENHKNR